MARTETKQKILETACEMFATFGYNNVSVRNLAKEADIAEGSLFYYFDTKSQILNDIFFQLLNKVDNTLSALGGAQMEEYIENESPRQVLRRFRLPFYEPEFPFLISAFSIALQENLTNETANEIVINKTIFAVEEKIHFVLSRLQERGDIPKLNISAFSSLWAHYGASTITLLTSQRSRGISPDKAEAKYESTIECLIDSALSGHFE